MSRFKPPRGMRDVYYEEAALRRKVIERLRAQFLLFGFTDFETPSVERMETLARKSGPDVAGQIYEFEDKAGRKLGLIFEFTASLGRAAASNPELLRPFKRYQIGRVWRYESPQANRYREFYQADIDIIGPYTMDCETEILLAVASVLRDFGLTDFVFLLNDRKVLRGQLETAGIEGDDEQGVVLRGLDKLDKQGPDDVRRYVLDKGIAEAAYGRFVDGLPQGGTNAEMLGQLEKTLAGNEQGRGGVAELREILELSAAAGLADRIRLTPHLVRGLDYYTGPIFEVRSPPRGGSPPSGGSPSLGNVSFGGGGRYDTLVEQFGGRPAGAVGFAFGVDRLVTVLAQEKLVTARRSEARLMIAPRAPALAAEAFRLASDLRAAGVPVFQYVGKAKVGKQLSFASRMGFPFVLVLGEDELATGVFKLKDMATGEETRVPRAELPIRLGEGLREGGEGGVPRKG